MEPDLKFIPVHRCLPVRSPNEGSCTVSCETPDQSQLLQHKLNSKYAVPISAKTGKVFRDPFCRNHSLLMDISQEENETEFVK